MNFSSSNRPFFLLFSLNLLPSFLFLSSFPSFLFFFLSFFFFSFLFFSFSGSPTVLRPRGPAAIPSPALLPPAALWPHPLGNLAPHINLRHPHPRGGQISPPLPGESGQAVIIFSGSECVCRHSWQPVKDPRRHGPGEHVDCGESPGCGHFQRELRAARVPEVPRYHWGAGPCRIPDSRAHRGHQGAAPQALGAVLSQETLAGVCHHGILAGIGAAAGREGKPHHVFQPQGQGAGVRGERDREGAGCGEQYWDQLCAPAAHGRDRGQGPEGQFARFWELCERLSTSRNKIKTKFKFFSLSINKISFVRWHLYMERLF